MPIHLKLSGLLLTVIYRQAKNIEPRVPWSAKFIFWPDTDA